MINLSDIIFTKRCPFCERVIKLSENECAACREQFPQSKIRMVKGCKCINVFPYTEEYRHAVLRYKFSGQRYLARSLALYMKEAVRENLPDVQIDCVTFVPVFKDKKFKFNHSERLAKYLAKYLSLPCRELLIKTVKTAKQHELSYEMRKSNIKNAFAPTADLSGKCVLIVDDIITTGNTLSECIRVLRLSGAEKIFAVTLCRVAKNG